MRCNSAGIGSSAIPLAELNSSGCRLACTMSARRVSAQNPGSVPSNTEGTGGCQLSPGVARSSAKVRSRASKVCPQNFREVMSCGLNRSSDTSTA